MEQDTDEKIAAEAAGKPLSERSAYLETACYGNEGLRDRVKEIVARLESETIGRVGPDDARGSRIGSYKLLQLIGEGGFGSVYMAEQLHPVRRKVALKIIKLGMDTRQVIARFEAERQALAMMDHPNIAKVLDAGATETGRPYFVMELVKGVAITEYADQNKLNVRRRLELFVCVCHAVQHAHLKGVIHRDIKPSNVLVALRDGLAVAKVIDFGIAKALHQKLTDKTLVTEFRQLIGTPEYMSPEQADIGHLDVDTRTDVYSLGALLYELLTGFAPFDARRLRSEAYPEIQRIICETDPPRPSTRMSGASQESVIAAARRGEVAQKLGAMLKRELDWVVMKAMEKDRSRRYETANALAEDLERYLRDEPVLARPPSATYRMRKFARRNRGLLAAGVAIAACLVIGLAAATVGLLMARTQRDAAVNAKIAEGVQREKAERRFDDVRSLARDFLFPISDAIERLPGSTLAREKVVKTALQYLDKLWAESGGDASLRWELAMAYERVGDIQGGPGANLGDTRGALESYEKARQILDAVAGAGRDADLRLELCNVQDKLGEIQSIMGNIREATALYERSQQLRQNLAESAPSDRAYQRALSSSYQRLGNIKLAQAKGTEALEFFQKSMEIDARLAQGVPADAAAQRAVAQSWGKLGSARDLLGQVGEAAEACKQSFDIYQTLAQAEPNDLDAKRNLSFSYEQMGVARWRAGENVKALELFNQSLEIRRGLADADPNDARAQRDLAVAHSRIADVLDASDRGKEALEGFEKAYEIERRLAAGDPSNLGAQLSTSYCLGRMADMRLKLQLPADGLYLEATRILKAVLETHPQYIPARRDLALIYEKISQINLQAMQRRPAILFAKQAMDVRRGLAAEDPKNVPLEHELAASCSLYSKALGAADEIIDSQRYAQEGVEIVRKYPLPQHLSATVTMVVGMVQARAAEDKPWAVVRVGAKYDAGTEFRTGVRSSVTLSIGPDQTIKFDRLGVFKLLDMLDTDGKVKSGNIHFQLEGLEEDVPTRTPNSTIRVRG